MVANNLDINLCLGMYFVTTFLEVSVHCYKKKSTSFKSDFCIEIFWSIVE